MSSFRSPNLRKGKALRYDAFVSRFLKEEIVGFLGLCALACALVPPFISVGPALLAWLVAA